MASALFIPFVLAAFAVRTFALVDVHANVTGENREQSTAKEADRGDPVNEQADCNKQDNDEDRKNSVFREQESAGAFADACGDFLHAIRSGVSFGNKADFVNGKQQSDDCHYRCQIDQRIHKFTHS